MAALLKPNGKLIGLLFDKDFGREEPPFGGTKAEYQQRFEQRFDIEIMEPSYNFTLYGRAVSYLLRCA